MVKDQWGSRCREHALGLRACLEEWAITEGIAAAILFRAARFRQPHLFVGAQAGIYGLKPSQSVRIRKLTAV